jgi:DNA-directed RNA polymerase sigma subunit (sigma70/sigma32)
LEKGAWGNWNPQPLAHDQRLVSSAEAVINVNLKDQTSHVLRTLTPREEKVIKMRFGFEDGSEHTLEEIGQSFAVTRERIRQIEAKGAAEVAAPESVAEAKGVSRRGSGLARGAGALARVVRNKI